MITEYKLVELTEEEKEGLSLKQQLVVSCNKCIAGEDTDLCDLLPECGETSYFIAVELKEN